MSEPYGIPALTRNSVSRMSAEAREQIWAHLAWWRNPKERLTNFKSGTFQEGNTEYFYDDPFGKWPNYKWNAFLYEAAARKNAEADGLYRWAFCRGGFLHEDDRFEPLGPNKPLCDLELHEAMKLFKQSALCATPFKYVTQGKIDAAEEATKGFSPLLSLNLTMRDDEIRDHVIKLVHRWREKSGIPKRPRKDEIPWEGLEIFDRAFLFPEESVTRPDAQKKRRALALFEKWVDFLPDHGWG